MVSFESDIVNNRCEGKHHVSSQRRRLNAKERHVRQQRQAQREIDALHQALQELGLPGDLAAEIEGRLRTQNKLLGKIFALMFPTLFGCRSAHKLTRTRGWDKNGPSRIRGALPKRPWIKRLRKLSQDIVSDIWHRVESMSPATRSRWQLTPVWAWPHVMWPSPQWTRLNLGFDEVLRHFESGLRHEETTSTSHSCDLFILQSTLTSDFNRS